MADAKISDLGDGGLPQPTDEFVVARGGTNNKIAWSSMSGGGGNGAAITISGNTAGAGALISTGTATLAGGNNITLSQNGNAITISGANAGGAQTGISGLANSQVTYTSGTVELVGTGAITVASSGGQQFVFSVDPQSVQPETQTFIGGVQASNATYTSGTVRISGSNAVTVKSGTGQLVIIDVPVQSTQPETQTFLSGIIASDTTYTSGNVRITGVGGGVTVSSNTGQRVDISVAAQSVQPETQTFIGGISASNTLYTSGSVRFSGSNAATIKSGTGQLVIVDVPTQTTQVETQTFIGGVVGSNATYTSGTVTFTGVGGGVTVSSNTGQRVDISVAAPVAQTNQAGSVYASSNTFGTSSGTYDARTLSIAGDGIISVAASNSGWRISATQSIQTQGNLSIGVSTGGNTAGNTTVNTGSRLVIVGSNGITASQGTAAGATTITLSGVTTAAQTNQAGSVYASSNTFGTSSGTYDARTLSIAGSGAVSVAASNSGWVVSAPTQTNQAGSVYAISNTSGTSSGTYDARTLSIAGAGIVTVAASNSGWRIDATTAAQTNQSGNVYASSNTFGTSSGTYDARSLSIAGRGEVSVAASNSGWIISSPVQTNQSGNVYASSNTFGTSSGTYDARSLSIAGSGAVSVAASNSGWVVSAPAQTTQTQGILNAGVSTGGNTSGDTTVNSGSRLVFAGGNNITLSQGTAAGATTITISAPNLGAGAMSVGVSTGGNTAGATGITGTQMVFVGSSPVSLSQTTGANGGTITINAPATSSLSATGAVSISTNGSTISIGAASSSLVAAGQVTISTNGSTVTVSVPNPTLSYRWIEEPLLMGATQGIGGSNANGTQTTVTAWVQPVSIPNDLAFNNVFLAAHNSFSSATTSISSVNYSFSMGASLGFYTLTGSTMSLVTSFSNSLGYSNATAANVTNMSLTARVGMGGSSTTKSTQGGANMTNIMSSINSVRKIPMNWTTIGNTLTRGQYWAVVAFSANTGGANQASLSQVGFVSQFSIMGSALNPPEMMKDTASVTSPYPFLGQATMINNTNSLMPGNFETSIITTATAIANSTKFQSIWMQIYSSHSN